MLALSKRLDPLFHGTSPLLVFTTFRAQWKWIWGFSSQCGLCGFILVLAKAEIRELLLIHRCCASVSLHACLWECNIACEKEKCQKYRHETSRRLNCFSTWYCKVIPEHFRGGPCTEGFYIQMWKLKDSASTYACNEISPLPCFPLGILFLEQLCRQKLAWGAGPLHSKPGFSIRRKYNASLLQTLQPRSLLKSYSQRQYFKILENRI